MQALSQLSYTPSCLRNRGAKLAPRLIHQQRCRRVSSSTCNTLAEWTGLEPATPGVTGRYSNQLNYHSAVADVFDRFRNPSAVKTWRPLGDSNPCSHRERVVS